MLVHGVYCWLRRDLSEQDHQQFRQGLEELRTIESVRALYVGTPAPTDGAPVDRTFDLALTVLFDDVEAHDTYQEHPKHQAFLKQFFPMLVKLVVYDAQ